MKCIIMKTFIIFLLFLSGCKFNDPMKRAFDYIDYSNNKWREIELEQFNISINNNTDYAILVAVTFPVENNPLGEWKADSILEIGESKTLYFKSSINNLFGYDKEKKEILSTVTIHLLGNTKAAYKHGYSRIDNGDIIIIENSDLDIILFDIKKAAN